MHPTLPRLRPSDFPALRRAALKTLQVNLGYRCNQQCLHCHVNASPHRREEMSSDTARAVMDYLFVSGAQTLDITGGAPELNANFRDMVRSARDQNIDVFDRCNLTILQEPGQEDLAEFLATHQVTIIASLPCYLESNVDAQRGGGVFGKSIAALRRLNELGYGHADAGLQLQLVYNPQGPVLPPPQQSLEADYKRVLQNEYGIVFNELFTLTNMPIQRFGSTLISKGEFDSYIDLLRGAYQEANLQQVMCRHLLSVDWQGYVYDCDFNQMLDLPLRQPGKRRQHVTDLMGVDLAGQAIAVANHCYGCTAGQGSSCGGALI